MDKVCNVSVKRDQLEVIITMAKYRTSLIPEVHTWRIPLDRGSDIDFRLYKAIIAVTRLED